MIIDDKTNYITIAWMRSATIPPGEERDREPRYKETTVIPARGNIVSDKDKKKEIADTGLKLEHFLNRGIRIEIDDELDRVIVKIVDKESGEVLRQIPPEDLIKLSKRLNRQSGIIFDVIIY